MGVSFVSSKCKRSSLFGYDGGGGVVTDDYGNSNTIGLFGCVGKCGDHDGRQIIEV